MVSCRLQGTWPRVEEYRDKVLSSIHFSSFRDPHLVGKEVPGSNRQDPGRSEYVRGGAGLWEPRVGAGTDGALTVMGTDIF